MTEHMIRPCENCVMKFGLSNSLEEHNKKDHIVIQQNTPKDKWVVESEDQNVFLV